MASPGDDMNASRAPQGVETGKRHKRGSRGRGSRVADAIQGTAHKRHRGWLEGAQPNATFRLTRELDELFDDRRGEQAGMLTDPYYGRTMRAGRDA